MFVENLQNLQECKRLFIKKEDVAKVLSCGFCGISKNTFFYRTPLLADLRALS